MDGFDWDALDRWENRKIEESATGCECDPYECECEEPYDETRFVDCEIA